MLKRTEKKTLAEIINYVSDMLTQRLSPRMLRRRLLSCGLTRRNIWKQTVTSTVNINLSMCFGVDRS